MKLHSQPGNREACEATMDKKYETAGGEGTSVPRTTGQEGQDGGSSACCSPPRAATSVCFSLIWFLALFGRHMYLTQCLFSLLSLLNPFYSSAGKVQSLDLSTPSPISSPPLWPSKPRHEVTFLYFFHQLLWYESSTKTWARSKNNTRIRTSVFLRPDPKYLFIQKLKFSRAMGEIVRREDLQQAWT